jgi:dihydroorotate dehydrogenase
MYRLIKPLLFRLDAEAAHTLTLKSLQWMPGFLFPKVIDKPLEIMGISFPNRIGLAAGLDKDGQYIDALAKLGFGFIEIGTVTPHPQSGNLKPRLFRINDKKVIINRMGFNNQGVLALIDNVKKARFNGILGINIGKNKNTPIARAIDDYLYCLEKVYPHSSYITVNISSPNTPDLRQLQQAHHLDDLVKKLKQKQLQLADLHKKYCPLVVKISPDEDEKTLSQIASILIKYEIDGVIATNTTCSREGLQGEEHAGEQGGLSGALLSDRATKVVATMNQLLQGKLPIIGVGGIMDAKSAKQKCDAGASLLQVYSGLIFKGPNLVKELVDAL